MARPDTRGYALLDTGDGAKLEAFGPVVLARPAPQVLWPKANPDAWNSAQGHYQRSTTGGGRWQWRSGAPSPWEIDCSGLRLGMQATGFGHLGVFPEQMSFWPWITSQCQARAKIQVLNLFAYTGGSTLAAARGGAQVTHCDSSKGIVTWAKENAARNELTDAPIRWIVDDVVKFLRREARRDRRYHGVILDPPSFGRGTKGEVWKLERDLPGLLELVVQVLAPEPAFVLLSAHTPGVTPLGLRNVLSQALPPSAGAVSCGEMSIVEASERCVLPSGTWSAWNADGPSPPTTPA